MRRLILLAICLVNLAVVVFAYDTNYGYVLPAGTTAESTSYDSDAALINSYSGSSSSTSYRLDFTLLNGQSSSADVVIISRQVSIISPTANGYAGSGTDIVPGSKIKYTITIRNSGAATANNYYIRDIVPNNTHLYYTGNPPTLNGEAINIEYQGTTSNAGPGAEIQFKYDLPPNGGEAYFKYTLTVD